MESHDLKKKKKELDWPWSVAKSLGNKNNNYNKKLNHLDFFSIKTTTMIFP